LFGPVNKSPRSQQPAHEAATEKFSGDGLPGVGSSGIAKLMNPVRTVKPVAPESIVCVLGKNAPIGLGGDPLAKLVIPRNSSKPNVEPAGHTAPPLAWVNGVVNGVAPTVPVAVAEVSTTLLGTSSFIKKLVPLWAGDDVTDTFKNPPGAGVNVPLSARHVEHVKCSGSSIIAAFAATPDRATAESAVAASKSLRIRAYSSLKDDR
jgi:hypothetical protein